MKKNGWQVSIDLKGNCDRNIVSSPLFDAEEKADLWYRELDFSLSEVDNNEIDVVLIHWVNNECKETHIY